MGPRKEAVLGFLVGSCMSLHGIRRAYVAIRRGSPRLLIAESTNTKQGTQRRTNMNFSLNS